jgi:hypothetical protein
MRFCSRCGLPLDGVSTLLAAGGVLKSEGGDELRAQAMSPRRRGIQHGVSMLIFGAVIVPILGIINSYQDYAPTLEAMVAIAAVIFFAGGLMRILYALLFESKVATAKPDSSGATPAATAPELDAGGRVSALPPAQSNPIPSFAPPRVNTAELIRPPSVTENTTRLLDEEKSLSKE